MAKSENQNFKEEPGTTRWVQLNMLVAVCWLFVKNKLNLLRSTAKYRCHLIFAQEKSVSLIWKEEAKFAIAASETRDFREKTPQPGLGWETFSGLIFYLLKRGFVQEAEDGDMQRTAYYLIKVCAHPGAAVPSVSVHSYVHEGSI